MHPTDASYLALVTLAGAAGRALRRGLPAGWRARLDATVPENLGQGWIWLHAVSVGELILAEGLIGKLLEEGHTVHITTGTTAGLALLEERIPKWDKGRGALSGGAFPLDDPAGLRAFFRIPPSAFIALETELWPNLLRELEVRGIPRMVVNGRLTHRTEGPGRPWLTRAVARLSLVAARDRESKEAFVRLGAPRAELGGNLKSDLPPPKSLDESWESLRLGWRDDRVLVAGSTLEGEEALVVEAWKGLRATFPSLRLILAPRQPKRFEKVADFLRREGLVIRRASQPGPGDVEEWQKTEALLLDSIGDLPSMYGEGTVALVGGGWKGQGGHNPLEPVKWGIPTLVGPGYRNFEDLVRPLEASGRLQVIGETQLEASLSAILQAAPLRGPGIDKVPALPADLEGSLKNTWSLIEAFLPRHG